jgi:predicted ATPase
MLQRIQLEHFKCFAELDLQLAPLTLLTGLNASGKSTVIQALTLLHQTLAESPSSAALVLNGKDVSLGTADDIEDTLSGRGSFTIGIEHDSRTVVWRMGAKKSSMVAPITAIEYRLSKRGKYSSIEIDASNNFRDLLPIHRFGTALESRLRPTIETLRKLTYISADRIGPRETYQASSNEQQVGVGARGEYTPWFIHQNEDLDIPEAMCHPDGGSQKLPRQVEAWLGHFFPGSGIDIQPLQRTSLLLMRLRASRATEYYRPVNVGYGLSHVLPVLTACLGAVGFAQQENRVAPLVLVENPELHLHPAGQSAMGVFLARTAASGAQVIVETHSDHVLNGIRRAIRGINGPPILSAEQVAIHFFQARDDANQQELKQVESPHIDQDGNIGQWPQGFFDQIEKDLIELL